MNWHKFPPSRFLFSRLIPKRTKGLYLDRYDFCISPAIARGTYEQEEVRLLRTIVTPGSIAVDIGANIGFFTNEFLKLGAEVHAFEPASRSFEILRKNAPQARLYRCAISDSFASKELYLNDYNHGDNRLLERGMDSEPVFTVPLDAFNLSPHFIKIDTQGSEVKVLRGARETIARSHPTLLVEYWPKGLFEQGNSGEELISLLEELGYDIRGDISGCSPGNGQFVNLLCVHSP